MLGVTNELIKKLTYITYLLPSSLLPFFFPFPNLTTEKSSYLTLISKHPERPNWPRKPLSEILYIYVRTFFNSTFEGKFRREFDGKEDKKERWQE